MADTNKFSSSSQSDWLEHDQADVPGKRVKLYSWNGTNWGKYEGSTPEYAVKMTVSGSITYVAYAAPGSSQASAVWQAKKIDETTGMVITWADGNANFDNVATDLTSLTYS